MDDSSFEAMQHRSPSSVDLLVAMKVHATLDQLSTITGGYIDNAEFLVVSTDGYVIGTWWWDSESEVWRFDPKRHGEART